MPQNPQSVPLFSQVDVTTSQPRPITHGDEQTELLRDVLSAQDRTNELLEELLGAMSSRHKQRNRELKNWKKANPELARSCRRAAEALSRVHTEYLDRVAEEINDSADDMVHGEFILNEFVDRFGPRLAHLNGMLQTLAQLSSSPDTPTAES